MRQGWMLGQGTMSAVRSEVFEAFHEISITEEKALKAASSLSQRDNGVETLKHDVSVMKWMMRTVLAFQVAIFIKLFIH
jgi:hypothetical protein